MFDVNHGKIDIDTAGQQAEANSWAAIPPRLLYEADKLPDQEWIGVNEAIGALILGAPTDINRTEDLRLTDDAEEAAAAALNEAAYQSHVHIHGKDPQDGQFRRIESSRFQERLQKLWFRDQIGFENDLGIWERCLVKVDTLKGWMKRQAAAGKKIKKRKNVMSPKERGEQLDRAIAILTAVYALNSLRSEKQDQNELDKEFKHRVKREIVRDARKK